MNPSPTTRYAGFWIRTVAMVIDTLLLTIGAWVLQLVVLGAIYWAGALSGARDASISFDDTFNPLVVQLLNAFLYLLISMPYFVIGHAKYRTTLGKRVVSVYVVDHQTMATMTWPQSWARFGASGLSYLPLLGGYFMVAFHPEKRALHDLLAKTVSLRVTREIA